MKNKIVSVALTFALLLLSCTASLAEGVERALPFVDINAFKTFAGFDYDIQTGEWGVRGNEADALFRFVREGGLASYPFGGVVVLYMQIDGNAQTGLYAPVLYALYCGPSLKAKALSLRIGDMRYDVSVKSEVVSLSDEESSAQVERITALLDMEALEWLTQIAETDRLIVRLHGEKTYTTELTRKSVYSSSKESIESTSLNCLSLPADLSAVLRFNEYRLWDMNARNWYSKTGTEPRWTKTDLSRESIPMGANIPALDTQMRMLSPGSSGIQVKKLETRLIELGYLIGKADNTYGTDTRLAVDSLQSTNGLLVTGSVDAQALRILFENAPPRIPQREAEEVVSPVVAEGKIAAEANQLYEIEDIAQLTINRYWAAEAVLPINPVPGIPYPKCGSQDNMLLIAEGKITNLSAEKLNLSRVQAKAICDGKYEYTVQCRYECDGGMRLDGMMLPLSEARLVLYAEVPTITLTRHAEWVIEIRLGESVLSYMLE